MRSITDWNCSWPKTTAPSIVASDSSLASLSTIITASRVPATTRSSALFLTCSMLGLRTYSSSMKPTRAAPIGPKNGTPLIVSAAEAATIARMSGSFSPSCASTVQMTCVSLLKAVAGTGAGSGDR